VPCTRRLTNPDISKVYACVFLTVKLPIRTLYKHISLKLMVYQFALMKEDVHRGVHALTGLMFAPSGIMSSYLNDRIDSDFLQFFLDLYFTTTPHDPNSFVELVQKFSVGNYRSIMGICGKYL